MCGIAGIFFKGKTTENGIIERMTQSMAHRGPDACGYYQSQNISFGHKRLSIIDVDACSNQPMSDSTGRYHIVFNGEIYNFKEIRNKIADYPYSSNGDTETILAAYIKWGPSSVAYLEGMFAFAIWDNHKQELFVTRDRLGVKPFYYYKSDTLFLFASEIRSLLSSGLVPRKVNLQSVSEFLQFQSVTQPYSVISSVNSLEAGYYRIISNTRDELVKYWQITESLMEPDFDKTRVKTKVHDLLLRSVERRMVSDVPIGAFLSGGIDSSAVVGLMASISKEPVNTFTIGFHEKKFNESQFADIIAKKFSTRHQTIMLRPEAFLEELIPALDSMDTPSGDGINSYVVSKAIRSTGITVALSGVGGDELFAGYPFFKQYMRLKKWGGIWNLLNPLRKTVAAVIQNREGSKFDRYIAILNAKSADIATFYPSFRQIISNRTLVKLTNLPGGDKSIISQSLNSLKPQLEKFPLLSQVSIAEYLGYTKNTLLNDMDQMSMAVSLEVREPFFDHHLIEYVLNIPDELKRSSYPKQLLVESLGDLLPNEIVHRKKQGFLFPWNEWMKGELRQFCESQIHSISTRDFIRKEELQSHWKKFLNGEPSVNWMEIWLFVVLEYWLQKNGVE